MAGDGAVQSADGYYRILGRIDDVINVAGHRLGTKEIESASLLVDEIAEAAVVPARDEIKGKVPDLYVSLKPGFAPSEDIRKQVEDSVIREIGPIARPRRIVIVPDMPKTRSGKIMRRVLGAISNNEDAGDISTLANPEIVDEIRRMKARP
jgi:acetyl-CoA synthetase